MSQIFLNLDILNFVVLIDLVLLGVEGKEGGSWGRQGVRTAVEENWGDSFDIRN